MSWTTRILPDFDRKRRVGARLWIKYNEALVMLNLQLGTLQRLVYTEEPALACYGSGRKGNLDFFFPRNGSSTYSCAPREGVAVELNYDYRDYFKVKKDIQKLIDPTSAHQQSLYFAYGKKHSFLESVVSGIERALNAFAEDRPEFRLPVGLHVIVVQYVRGGGHTIHESAKLLRVQFHQNPSYTSHESGYGRWRCRSSVGRE